ncbi:MAG: aldose 1-epimerase [Actinomycetota bacterium]|nr:aldose 1-epimerase [Actinomycetota bacterium]
MSVRTVERNGWDITRVTLPPVEVDVLPAKGADILALRYMGLNLLWTSPWGLRPREELTATDSTARFLQSYPGGWQTIFPNGGEPCVENGVEWGFHGEACMVPWRIDEVEETEHEATVRLSTMLTSLPARVGKEVRVDAGGLHVTETIQNSGTEAFEAMWSQHPAFGAPLISESSRIECDATTFVTDAQRDVDAGDLQPGARSAWPHATRRDGQAADLQILASPKQRRDRFGYLTDFKEGFAAITNSDLGLRVEMRWDTAIFPHAWYWLEAHATQGYPWFGDAYVFAIEPASSYPGHGIASVRAAGGTLVRFEPWEQKTARTSLTVIAL